MVAIIEGTVPGNLPKRSKIYCAWSATHSLNSSLWIDVADRIFRDSFHGPGVSGWKGPPGPNLRSHSASTAARILEKCGGQQPSMRSTSPVGFGYGQRSFVSKRNPT